ALEVRHLQRTEVREAQEPFSAGQKGSSAMPHKRNPVTSEQICGLARVVRSNAQAAFENVALWHERDITHSSVERVILPDSCILLDYMLHVISRIIEKMHVYPENMMKNLGLTNGLIFSQSVLLRLTEKGMKRDEAYAAVQRCAMEVWQTKREFKEALKADLMIASRLNDAELDALFDLKKSMKSVDYIFKN